MKPEHRYRQRVTQALPKKVHVWAIADSFVAGVPDHWYSGAGGDLWAEYKFFPDDRAEFDLTSGAKPKLTRLQQRWLNRRRKEGRNVCVIVGFPSYGVILRDGDWNGPVTVTEMLTPKEIAQWISSQTLPSTSRLTTTISIP